MTLLRTLALGLFAVALISCSAPRPEDYNSDQELFEKAKQHFDKKRFEEAISHFDNLMQRFPQSPLVVESELLIADGYFLKGDHLEAEFAYASFRKLRPTHPKSAYIVLQLGKTHLARSRKSPARDQTQTKHAIRYFAEVVRSWPGSPEAQEALNLQNKAERRLVEHDLYVAQFYVRQKQYAAAIPRFETAMSHFEHEDLQDKAQYKLAYALYKNNEFSRSQSELAKIPNRSPYFKKAESLLSKMDGQQTEH